MPFDFGAALGAAKEQISIFRKRDRAERLFDENDQYELQEGGNQPTPDLIRKLPDDNREANEQGGQYAGRLYYGENAADAFMDQRTGISKYLDPDMLFSNMPKRYTIAALACIGFIISVGMRTNLGVAKLKMLTNHSDIHWSFGGLVAAETSFLWGYAVTQIPGGFIAAKFPANKVFGLAIAISCGLNILLPIAAHFSVVFFVFIRIIQGLLEGVTYPACHGIWRHWAPPIERSRLATLAFCGCYGGTVFGLALSGILADNFGWPTPFVVFGLLGLIWYFFWLWLSFEKPAKHPTITQQELIYIEESLGNVAQSYPTLATTPWKSIFTSMPVYAIIVANFCRSWTFYLLLFSQPKYFKDVFKESVQESGITGALPHLCMTIIVPFGGQLADHLRKSGKFTTTQVRKIFNCGGFGMEAFFLIVVSHATTKFGAVFSLILAVGSSGFAISGFNVNHLDIAPRYASILMGFSNGCGTFAGLICTILTQAMTKRGGAWADVFIIAGCVHFCGVIFYALFASGELQPWAEPPPDPDHVPAWKIRQESIQRQMSIKQGNPPLARANEQLSGSLNGVQQPKYGATSDVQQTSFYSSIPESQEPPQSGYPTQRGYGYGDGREY